MESVRQLMDNMVMKQWFFFAVAILVAAFAWQESAFAANRRHGSEPTDSVRAKAERSRRMLCDGDLDGAVEQWLSAEDVYKKIRLKKNKRNIERLISMSNDINSLSDTIFGTLFRNRDYAAIQNAVKMRKVAKWYDEPYTSYLWSFKKQESVYPIYSAGYGNSGDKFVAGDTVGVGVKMYLEYLYKVKNSDPYWRSHDARVNNVYSVLPLMDKDACDAAELYWKWYRYERINPHASETVFVQKQYEAKYGVKYGWDLTKIYGPMYSDYAETLIRHFWLDEEWLFDRLCLLDLRLGIRYAKMYGYNNLYAKAIAPERPEEAFEISGNPEYLKRHQRNLGKWNFTEIEYQKVRAGFDNWDSFYAFIKGREKDIAFRNELREMKRRRDERYEQARRRERADEVKRRDKTVLDDYKPRVAKAMSNDDYLGAERLAKEALGKMSGGDAYLYYACAYAYYKKTLDFDLGTQENAHEYFLAYRNEAQHLVEMCNRSLNLDSTSSNDAYFVRGLAYIVLGYTDSAISDFERLSARSDETGAVSCYNIGIAAKNAKRWSSAIEAFKRARERSSSDSIRSKSLTHIKTCQEKLK